MAILAGQLSGIYTQVGVDTAAHMSEEVKSESCIIATIPMKFMLTDILPQTPQEQYLARC